MAQTPYLAIEQIAPAQDSPYLTANDAVVALEAAINRTLEVDLTEGAVELSQAQFTRYVLFRCSGHTTTTNLTVPDEITTDEGTQTTNRLFLIRNAGTGNVNVTDGSASLAVEPSTTAIIVYDGTSFYVAASGASATNFTDLGDVPAAYTSAAGRQLRVNSAPDGIEFVATVIQVETSDVTNSENYTTLDFDDPFFTATASGGVVTFGIDPTALNITDLADMPTAPGPSQDGQTLAWNNSAGEYEFVDVGVSEVPVVDWKESVRAATTAAGTLASDFEDGDTVDGVTLATGDRILVQDQASASENGIYTVNASGAPTRATDFDEDAEVTTGAVCYVEEGTANGGKLFILTTTGSITVGSSNLSFSEINGNGGAENFTDLDDAPGSYSSHGGKLLAVTSGEDGIEFVDAPESGPNTLTENEQTGTTYTFVIGDANDVLVAMNNGAVNTLTVPPNSSVAFDVGTILNVHQKGAGQTTLAEGSGVTISYPSAGSLALREQNSVVSLVKTATDTWVLAGDLEPASSGALDAEQVAYDNTTSGLSADEAQAAIDEIVAGLGSVAALDHESGTWTPTLICATPGDLAVSYSIQSGEYRRIGDLVTVTGRIVCTPTFSTASGAVRIGGSPFTASGQVSYIALNYVEKISFVDPLPILQSSAGNTFFSLRSGDPMGVGVTSNTAVSALTSGVEINVRFTITFTVTGV
ncbi:hypothetical protein [Candidatus Macondimonas diazotrophica]|uniref:Uncharacterized protein n=1 Tax=Candidatus Macondimonas diazotrophica TaxID=2305248 RepID=A0A4Z0F7X9_9GAMM|nr:hypothetical protein [Candidatus Macondimonas diazotrophica]TFZ81580.1 hypothetical protein E4680_11805 [Candidatus Macondimonas diazotrophica]